MWLDDDERRACLPRRLHVSLPVRGSLTGEHQCYPGRAAPGFALVDPRASQARRSAKPERLCLVAAVREDAYHSLARRDLQRGQATALPSGEAVARELGIEPLARSQVGLAQHGSDAERPLWYYVLPEADVQQQGDSLGEVGGRIVGEVLVRIIDADPESYRSVYRAWRPTLPAAAPDRYTDGPDPRTSPCSQTLDRRRWALDFTALAKTQLKPAVVLRPAPRRWPRQSPYARRAEASLRVPAPASRLNQ
ncbi:MAG: hypothetical protein ACXVVQ_07275 [Solirubrobacteraceae bacterium]